MNFRRGNTQDAPKVNLIPLIDVVLVIIIFLTLTTTFNKTSGLEIALPTADAGSQAPVANEITVAVTAAGEIVINDAPVADKSIDAIAAALGAAASPDASPAPVVVINADAQAAHQRVIDVMQAAQAAGLPHITFAVQQQPR
jgi:biopolymer transport protein ExbD